MNAPRASLGHLLVAWPLFATAYRAVLAAQEGLPVARQGLKLVRAEARLARESVPGVLWASIVGLVGFWILLSALVAGGVGALVAAGWALPWAVLLPATIGLIALLGGAFWAWRGVERLSFVRSRERLKALLEVIDED